MNISARTVASVLGLLAISAASCGPERFSGRDAGTNHLQEADGGGEAGTGGGGGSIVADGGDDVAADGSGLGEMGGATNADMSEAAGDLLSEGADAFDMTTDGGADVPSETCGPDGHGCARLSVPLTDPQTGTFFAISIPTADLSGVSAVFRLCLVPSAVRGSGWVQPYAQEGASPFNGQFDVLNFASVPACPTFLDYTFNFSDAPDPASDAGSPWFTRVQSLGVKIQSLDGATGSWADPTVVYVDSVILSRRAMDGGVPDDAGVDGGAPDDAGVDGGATPDSGAQAPLPGPFTFDTSSNPFGVNSYQAVPGSALDWVP
jgi:hypothetical protein